MRKFLWTSLHVIYSVLICGLMFVYICWALVHTYNMWWELNLLNWLLMNAGLAVFTRIIVDSFCGDVPFDRINSLSRIERRWWEKKKKTFPRTPRVKRI